MEAESIKRRLKILKKYDEKIFLLKKSRIKENKKHFEESTRTVKKEYAEVKAYLTKARKLILKKKENFKEDNRFNSIEKRLIGIENDLYSVFYLNTFYNSKEGIEIRKQYRIPNNNGFFEAIGIIGGLGFNHKHHLTAGEIISRVRGVECYYSSKYSTLQKNRFLKFNMNRSDIKIFCKTLLEKDEDDFIYWLEDFLRMLTPPTMFNKPPYDPKYCLEIRVNGIFNGLNESIHSWLNINETKKC